MPSVQHRPTQTITAGHEPCAVRSAVINAKQIGATRMRTIETAFAGVASADGPNELVTDVRPPATATGYAPSSSPPRTTLCAVGLDHCFEVGTGRADDNELGELTHTQRARHRDNAVDFRRFTVGATLAGAVDQHLDRCTDQVVSFGGGDAILPLA